MRSVADDFRDLTRRRTLDLPAEARVEQALALGDEDARLFAAAHGVDVAEARRRLARVRQLGRYPSRAAEQP
jgi:hypothetical protein